MFLLLCPDPKTKRATYYYKKFKYHVELKSITESYEHVCEHATKHVVLLLHRY